MLLRPDGVSMRRRSHTLCYADTEHDQTHRSEHLFGQYIRQIQADLIGIQWMPILVGCAVLTAPILRLVAICTGAQ